MNKIPEPGVRPVLGDILNARYTYRVTVLGGWELTVHANDDEDAIAVVRRNGYIPWTMYRVREAD
jgi:hypothetical protein